ncbi:hypothetical protein PLESTM_000727400 [Pleodorina starrii]|nr:hypothetical protein PLESTM_000727400 [Pleodorina starrii]
MVYWGPGPHSASALVVSSTMNGSLALPPSTPIYPSDGRGSRAHHDVTATTSQPPPPPAAAALILALPMFRTLPVLTQRTASPTRTHPGSSNQQGLSLGRSGRDT